MGTGVNAFYGKKEWMLLNVAQEYQDVIQRGYTIVTLVSPEYVTPLIIIYSPTMLIVRHATRSFSLSRATFYLMEECMYGLSLIRLGLFIALAIIASTAIGLFTYVVVSALAE